MQLHESDYIAQALVRDGASRSLDELRPAVVRWIAAGKQLHRLYEYDCSLPESPQRRKAEAHLEGEIRVEAATFRCDVRFCTDPRGLPVRVTVSGLRADREIDLPLEDSRVKLPTAFVPLASRNWKAGHSWFSPGNTALFETHYHEVLGDMFITSSKQWSDKRLYTVHRLAEDGTVELDDVARGLKSRAEAVKVMLAAEVTT